MNTLDQDYLRMRWDRWIYCRLLLCCCLQKPTSKMIRKVLQGQFLRSIVPLSIPSRGSKLWEPDYLILAKTKTPEYDEINLQIRGYDFVVVERFQKVIHQIAVVLGLDVVNAWAVPAQHLHVKRFREGTAVAEMEVDLKKYERVVQVADPNSHQVPLLLDAVTTACPAGVTLQVLKHTPEQDEIRYVPDLELIELRDQLAAFGGPRKK